MIDILTFIIAVLIQTFLFVFLFLWVYEHDKKVRLNMQTITYLLDSVISLQKATVIFNRRLIDTNARITSLNDKCKCGHCKPSAAPESPKHDAPTGASDFPPPPPIGAAGSP